MWFSVNDCRRLATKKYGKLIEAYIFINRMQVKWLCKYWVGGNIYNFHAFQLLFTLCLWLSILPFGSCLDSDVNSRYHCRLAKNNIRKYFTPWCDIVRNIFQMICLLMYLHLSVRNISVAPANFLAKMEGGLWCCAVNLQLKHSL